MLTDLMRTIREGIPTKSTIKYVKHVGPYIYSLESVQRGKVIYEEMQCFSCHGPRGKGHRMDLKDERGLVRCTRSISPETAPLETVSPMKISTGPSRPVWMARRCPAIVTFLLEKKNGPGTWCAGADFINSARGFMFALVCILALKCNTNLCPTGVTSHNPRFQSGLDPRFKSVGVDNYCRNIVHEVEMIAHACGVAEPRALQHDHVRIVGGDIRSRPMDENKVTQDWMVHKKT